MDKKELNVLLIEIFEKGLEILGKKINMQVIECVHYENNNILSNSKKRYNTVLERVFIGNIYYWVGKCPEGCIFYIKEQQK